ncbi:MAG TPA: cytochrome c oxidase subunit II [Candidatus Acidoferrales bacterium]|nr:cytochrome c oxidase subunit II [Candidatus Acidoferrales bacterium]
MKRRRRSSHFAPEGRFARDRTRGRPLRAGEEGRAAAATMLAITLAVLVGIAVYFFLWGKWGPPAAITRVGNEVDRQYRLTLAVTGAIFVVAQLGLAFAIFRYRDRGQGARYSHGNAGLEILWTSATTVIFLGLGLLGYKAWGAVRLTTAAPGAIPIEVTTSQFVYEFRYAGPDGRFGMTNPKLISPSNGNPVGLDPNDPAGRDDIVVPALTVPVNREIDLLIRSQDVIHSVFVRELRLQQDAVPGLTVPLHFTADKTGTYDIVCTQLCGLGHSRMHSYLNVVSEAEYESFLKRQERMLQTAGGQ